SLSRRGIIRKNTDLRLWQTSCSAKILSQLTVSGPHLLRRLCWELTNSRLFTFLIRAQRQNPSHYRSPTITISKSIFTSPQNIPLWGCKELRRSFSANHRTTGGICKIADFTGKPRKPTRTGQLWIIYKSLNHRTPRLINTLILDDPTTTLQYHAEPLMPRKE